MNRVVVLISGRGSNMQALLEALANREDLQEGQTLAEADSRAIERSRKSCEGLTDVFRQCLASATEARWIPR